MSGLLTLGTNKYAIKIENFEGPLDLCLTLIEKNKMSIADINISQIADQYIEYLDNMDNLNLDIASEFIIMASTLLYLKSKSLLPNQLDEKEEITQEELIKRIIEYKRYKEISKVFKENFIEFSKRFYKTPSKIELPEQKIELELSKNIIIERYKELLDRNKEKINVNKENIEKIAIHESVSLSSKIKEIFKELLKNKKFTFNNLFSIKKVKKLEVITAFTGILELSRRNKITITQKELFSDIVIEKKQR